MTTKKITDLTSQSTPADADVFPHDDVDVPETKKITASDLKTYFQDGVVLADGTVAMSADLDVGSNNVTNVGTVDGVDVSDLERSSVSTISSNKTLADSDNNGTFDCDTDTAGGDITISVPDSLTAGTYATFIKKGTGGNVLFTNSGSMTALRGSTTISDEDGVAGAFVLDSTHAIIFGNVA